MLHPQEEMLTVNLAGPVVPSDDAAEDEFDGAEVGDDGTDDEDVDLEEDDLDETEEVGADEVFDD